MTKNWKFKIFSKFRFRIPVSIEMDFFHLDSLKLSIIWNNFIKINKNELIRVKTVQWGTCKVCWSVILEGKKICMKMTILKLKKMGIFAFFKILQQVHSMSNPPKSGPKSSNVGQHFFTIHFRWVCCTGIEVITIPTL